MKADIQLVGHMEKIKEKNHLQFEKIGIKLFIEKSHIHLKNLFAQDPVIGKATNDVVSDNSELFVTEILPSLESSLADKFTEISNTITKTFTYEELFPIG